MIEIFTIINGFDMTDYIPKETLLPCQNVGDQLPQCTFDVVDLLSNLNIDTGMEVIIWNEYARFPNGPAIPAQNLVQLLAFGGTGATGSWSLTGAISIFGTFPTFFPVVTFSNTTYSGGNNFQLATAITPPGYIHAGQSYMFSIYATIPTPLTNALAVIQMQFQDGSGNLLGSPTTLTFASTVGGGTQHVNVSAVAPANAYYLQVWFGGQVTVSGTNSGTINWGTPQAEPMWFVGRGVSYPTPDNNFNQVWSAKMPDSTVSRACRIYAGYIDDYKIDRSGTDYAEGPARTWHIQCAAYGAILENATVTGAYESQYDTAIIQSAFTPYSNWLNFLNPANTSSPNPLIQSAFVDSISFNENTLRDVLNSLAALSGCTYYVDPYATLYYLPSYYNAASFILTDAQPDNVTKFSYYDYENEKDATQQKWDIIVIGGHFISGAISDNFTGNGSTTVFNLSQQPYNIQSCTVGGVSQKLGVKGRDKFGTSAAYQALYDKAAKTLTFNTAPGNTVAVVITYTYEAPAVVECIDHSINMPNSPAYALPPFISKVHDTNLTSIAAATTRGLQELNAFARANQTITCKSQAFALIGQIIYFTATKDNIINQPYVVQEVDASYLGNGNNEFAYTLGYYIPKFTDHSRHIHQATVRSTTTASVDAVQQTDLVISEYTAYSEVVTATPIGNTAPTLVYGSGTWGGNSW